MRVTAKSLHLETNRYESDLRGLTYWQALKRPYLRPLYLAFGLSTFVFLLSLDWRLMLLAVAYWVFGFGIIWLKWRGDNKPRTRFSYEPPFRNPPAPSN